MKTLLRLAPLFLSVLLIGCAQNPSKSGGFSPSGSGFSVNMPGTAQSQVTGKNNTHIFTSEVDGRAYIASYADLGAAKQLSKSQIDRVLDGASNGVASNGSKLLSKKAITIDGHDGRDLRLRLKSGHFMHMRMTLVDARLFQVGVVTEMSDADAPQIAAYLNSFHVNAH